jgi:hypothetical protein
MAAALAAFRSRVLPNLPSCPDILVDQAVLDACIEFCEKTNIVRFTSDPTAVASGEYEIDIDTPTSSKVVQVQRVWIGATELTPLQEDDVGVFGFTEAVTGETVANGTPTSFGEIRPGTIALYPRPNSTVYITTRSSIKPSRSATSVDDVLYEDWVNVIASGALYRLYTMKAEWQDTARAGIELAAFKQGVGNAILESRRGRNRSDDVVRPAWI